MTTSPTVEVVTFDRKTAAQASGMSESWLRAQDRAGTGAPKIRMGRRIFYPKAEFFKWVNSHLETK